MRNKQSLPDLLKQLAGQGTEKVKVAITDIDGILRGKVMSFDKFRSIAEKGFGFCDVVFGWDAGDQAYDNARFTGWHTGYPDVMAVVDIDTFRQVPWEHGMPFFLADFRAGDGGAGAGGGVGLGGTGKTAGAGEGLPVCPRGLLKKIVKQAGEEGFAAFFSQEFEWYNFLAPGARSGDGGNEGSSLRDLKPMTEGMFGYSILRASQGSAYFHDLFDLLKKFDVPLEGLHTETGPGVYEAAILYAEVLEAADRAVLFKTAVKEIGHRHGILPTFMAKVSETLPGCSGHVHQSLWSVDGGGARGATGGSAGKNLFYDERSATGMSALLESYIAGQLFCLPHILPMYAPTVNSYKRLVEGAWAPTTPTWAIDNRTTALRVLLGGPTSTRLETRVVGSDTNPYLAMAGCLASGLYGIRNKLTLTTPATTGSGYADKAHGTLPRNLWEATQAMRQSPLAAELFGAVFADHFTGTRDWEWRQFSRVVTDWELKRYLEII